MMHRAWGSIGEVPYSFSRSYFKFQGHTALKIVEFDPNWAFPDSNSSLNSPMAMKCCTKLETAKERCPIVYQGHPSNFKVTRDKTSPVLSQIGRFRTIGRSQLSNPSDLPCYNITSTKIWLLNRNVQNESMGRWPCCCRFTGQDNSIKLVMEQFGQGFGVTVPTRFECLTKIPGCSWWVNDRAVAHLLSKTVP